MVYRYLSRPVEFASAQHRPTVRANGKSEPMQPVTKLISLLTLLLALTLSASPANAGTSGEKILRKYEKKFKNFKGLYMKYKLYIGSKLKARFVVRTRPSGQRLTKFTAPGDVKGMHFLIQSRSEMYIYLPAFRKVRRIAGHVRNQGLLGSGFSYDDMSISTWSKLYTVRLTKTTTRHYYLDLKLRPGKSAAYPRLKMRIRRDLHVADRLEYLNRHSKKQKTQYFGGYACNAGKTHCAPKDVKMVEHTRGNRTSRLKCTKLKYKSGFKDRMFSVRYLLRSAD